MKFELPFDRLSLRQYCTDLENTDCELYLSQLESSHLSRLKHYNSPSFLELEKARQDNPITLVQGALHRVAAYKVTHNEGYLSYAEDVAAQIINLAQTHDDALFFPYDFDFALHSYSRATLKAPWFSAMCQGQMLQLITRLSVLLDSSDYRDYAISIFNSFDPLRFNTEGLPWVTYVDNKDYLWLEEYPLNPSGTHALNGKIFAMFGIYEFMTVTKEPQAEEIFSRSLKTIKAHIQQYYHDSGISCYCLAHPEIRAAGYHTIHLDQLRILSIITGDPYYDEMALYLNNGSQ